MVWRYRQRVIALLLAFYMSADCHTARTTDESGDGICLGKTDLPLPPREGEVLVSWHGFDNMVQKRQLAERTGVCATNRNALVERTAELAKAKETLQAEILSGSERNGLEESVARKGHRTIGIVAYHYRSWERF